MTRSARNRHLRSAERVAIAIPPFALSWDEPLARRYAGLHADPEDMAEVHWPMVVELLNRRNA
jgi:hypothetical protein